MLAIRSRKSKIQDKLLEVLTNTGVSHKTNCACRRALEPPQLSRSLMKPAHRRVRLHVQRAAAQHRRQALHQGFSTGKALLHGCIVEAIFGRLLVPHVVWRRIRPRIASAPGGSTGRREATSLSAGLEHGGGLVVGSVRDIWEGGGYVGHCQAGGNRGV